MMAFAFTLLTLLALFGTGLLGGVFFAFSNFVMKGLGRIPPTPGISAMQSINVTVLNPGFLGAFIGAALVSLVLLVAWFVFRNAGLSPLLPLSALIYLVGGFAVTVAFNVPLNDRLAALDPAGVAAAEAWTHYLTRWTLWNHIRTLACLLAAAGFLGALLSG